MEALQTDVMRFMAILGLCLAAIFSLVKSPDFTPVQAAAESESTPPAESESTPPTETAPDPAPLIEAKPRPDTAPRETVKQGFQLVFASADDLRQLLTHGEAALYATDGAHYWRWRPGGVWHEVASPASYYRMERATLPDGFMQGAPAALAGTQAIWGIDLPAGIVSAIGRQMQGRSGGVLIIDGRGGVSVEPSAGTPSAVSR